jgi:RNA polymerase sigma factor (sigma-70 family)
MVLINPNPSFDDESIEVRELKDIISRFTELLPERGREVFQLSREKHLTNKEIAALMGISEKTVEVHLTRALKKLRIELGRMNFWIFLL